MGNPERDTEPTEQSPQEGRQRGEQTLHEGEEHYRIVAEAATDAIITIDEESRILFVNPGAERIFGYASAEMLGQRLTMLMPEHLRDVHRTLIQRYVETGKRHLPWEAVEFPGRHKSGKEILLEISFGAFLKNGQHIFTGIIRDITERKHLEEQLRQAQKMEAIGRLAGGIAHDFNNVLTVILGYSQLLHRLGPGDVQRSYTKQIIDATERATALIQQLLAFSRKQDIQPQVSDLKTLVANTVPMLRHLIDEDVELVTVMSPLLGRVKADPGQLEQVLMNLALNARDAMPQGDLLTLELANVELDEAYVRDHIGVRPGPYVRLAVRDTGYGMDTETQAHLFEPFFTTKTPGSGAGLGLSTVYGIVAQSGGLIEVDSAPGHGATFTIYLPRVEDAVEVGETDPPPTIPRRGVETILLVEDEAGVRELVREMLHTTGYTVLEAANGAHALLIGERHPGPIHLLLTDVVMPGVSGPEVAQRLARVRGEMKVLYMSGYTRDVISHHGVTDADTRYVQKPFTPDALAYKVREVLDADLMARGEPYG